MALVKRVETYVLDGVNYKSIQDLKNHIENEIGSIIDSSDSSLSPSQKLNILEAISRNKLSLEYLLSIHFESIEKEPDTLTVNVLDS